MPSLLLHTQGIATLEKDNEVNELIIAQEWLAKHTVEQINLLSSIYSQVKKLNLSDIDLLRISANKITAVAMAFPEIVELILGESGKQATKIVQQIVLGLPFLQGISFAEPPTIPRSLFSGLGQQLSFWYQPKSPVTQHHHLMRDIFDVTQISEGQSNILQDWNRLDTGPVEINDQPIQTLIHKNDKGELFATEEALRAFFKTELLCNLSADQLNSALEYTMKVLHQGGLLHPVSAAIYSNSAKKPDWPQPVDSRHKLNGVSGQEKITRFNATATGFIVHEKLIQNRLAYTIAAGDKAGDLVLPDKNEKFVYSVEAKLKIDWNPAEAKPKISIDTTGVTFGSALAQTLFDERFFYQKIIDNVGYYMGLNYIDETQSMGL